MLAETERVQNRPDSARQFLAKARGYEEDAQVIERLLRDPAAAVEDIGPEAGVP